MNGQLSLSQLTSAVENGAMMQGLASDLAEVKRLLAARRAGGTEGGGPEGAAMTSTATTPLPNLRLARQYNHGGNVYRRVPRDWKFPKLGLQPMYAYWHCGNENDNIPPIKWLQCSDVAHVGKRARATLAEMTLHRGKVNDNKE